MKRLAYNLVSHLVLVCLLAVIAPTLTVHHHEADRCDQTDPALESDPCHVAIHHAGDVQRPHCEHASHVDHKHDRCGLCKFLTTTRFKYISTESYRIDKPLLAEAGGGFLIPGFAAFPATAVFNRGPPN